MHRKSILLKCILLLIVTAAIPAHAQFVQPAPCKNSFTPEQEITEGKKAAAEVYKTMPVLPDSSAVTQYIQRLGAKLVAVAPGYRWPYEFHVVNQAEINAFALPGGPVFINLGTIQAADTEAQLAGVMAHEISHVVMRHATCNITKQNAISPWVGLGQLAAGVLLPGVTGAAVSQLGGAAAGLGFLKMGRDAEKQADLMGVNILYDAGYDPRGLPQFFEVIQGKYGSGGTQFLSDHPNPGDRTEYVDAEIDTLPPRAHAIKTTAEFTKMKKLAAGMHAYSAKEVASGAWKKNAAGDPVTSPDKPIDFAPGKTWSTLSATSFSLQYPANWHVAEKTDGATIAPENGVVPTGNGSEAVVYGVLMDVFQPQPGSDLSAATSQLMAAMQQGNAGMKAVTQMEDIRVNQQVAKSIEFVNQGASAGGAAERDWLVTMERSDGSLYYLVFVAPQKDFEALRPTYEQMLRTFRLK